MKKKNSRTAPKIYFEPYHYAGLAKMKKPSSNGAHIQLENYFSRHFGNKVVVTPNGRMAISLIMRSLKLRPDDEIYITTTFEKPNVSSCVTSTIFNYCKPSRVMTDKTRAIFIIHEFGVPHPRLKELSALAKRKGVPLIEDCAHSIGSITRDGVIGTAGDYTICSFAKIFPVRHGGLLVGQGIAYEPTPAQAKVIRNVRRALTRHIGSLSLYANRKIRNFRSLEKLCASISLKPLFKLKDGISPSFFFPLVTDRHEELLDAARDSGIECALWHGTNVVVFPMHQYLGDGEIKRIFSTIKAVHAKRPALVMKRRPTK